MSDKTLRHLRLKISERVSGEKIFERQTHLYEAIFSHLSIAYVVFAFFALRSLRLDAPNLNSILPPHVLFFAHYYSPAVYLVTTWLAPVALIVAATFNRSKVASVVALSLFIHWGALQNIFGIADNGHRPAIWLAMMLVFLPFPETSSSRLARAKFINHYWFSLLVFLLSYVLSGLWKVLWGGGYQLLFDNYGIWNYKSLAYIISEYMIKTGMRIGSAEWFITHPFAGWIPFMIAVFAESTIWIVFFRPSLWRIYAGLILMMHMGTYLTLAISFETQFLLAGLLMFTSPFYVARPFLESLFELPLIREGRKLFLRYRAPH